MTRRLTDEELTALDRRVAELGAAWGTTCANVRDVIAELKELRSLRLLLATPCETEVTWHNNGRGPRVVLEVGSEDYIVTTERALSLGAALIRAAIEATSSITKEPHRG
jgi:hypothetical protein